MPPGLVIGHATAGDPGLLDPPAIVMSVEAPAAS
jgi:hypothetical protein